MTDPRVEAISNEQIIAAANTTFTEGATRDAPTYWGLHEANFIGGYTDEDGYCAIDGTFYMVAFIRDILPRLFAAADAADPVRAEPGWWGRFASKLRKERDEVWAENARLRELVKDAQSAISAAYQQADAEWRDHDKLAGKYADEVHAWRERGRRALENPTSSEERA
jgi:hypothetical protein